MGIGATIVEQFNQAFNEQDVTAVMALMTEDVVFEGTTPPDGDRHVGADAVRAEWQRLFTSTLGLTFRTEELIEVGDRVVVRWEFSWNDDHDVPGHVRGVDVFTVRDGRISEKLSYVKG